MSATKKPADRPQLINIFDFDGTLTTETWPKFWVWAKKFGYDGSKRNDSLEEALAKYRQANEGGFLETFFSFFDDLLLENDTAITLSELMEGEKFVVYNPGVLDFFKKSQAKNYIISGGLEYFLQNLQIAPYFDGIFGTPVLLDQSGNITRIGSVMTDDKKVSAIREILKENDRKDSDCLNVNFIGDGVSDAPAMRFVHSNNGKSIFVHQPHQDDGLYHEADKVYQTLRKENAIDECCVADYRPDSDLYKLLQ